MTGSRPHNRLRHGWAALLLALLPHLAGDASGDDVLALPLLEAQVPTTARLETQWTFRGENLPLRPVAVDVHPSGFVSAIEDLRHRVFYVSSNGTWLGFAEREGSGLDLTFATRVFARSGLYVYALDPEERIVHWFDVRGRWKGQLDVEAAVTGGGEEINRLVDFCLDRAGKLFLLDAGRGRIFGVDPYGQLESVLGTWGDWTPVAPVALEIDGRGRLYLLESQPATLLVLDVDGRILRRTPLSSEDDRQLAPAAMAVDPWGNAFIADPEYARVMVVPIDGTPPWWIRSPNDTALQARDLGFDDTGRLLAADPRAARIWVFALQYETRARPREPDREP